MKVLLHELRAAIVLPEQSVASEKAGLAVSRKGLTLKELLQQTSHHNSKVRKGTYYVNLELRTRVRIGAIVVGCFCGPSDVISMNGNAQCYLH